jgi:hypothetical protein
MKTQNQLFDKIGKNASDIIELVNYVLKNLDNHDCDNKEFLSAKKHLLLNLSLLKGLSGLFESALNKYESNVKTLELLEIQLNILQQGSRDIKNSTSNSDNNKYVVNKYGKLEEYPS